MNTGIPMSVRSSDMDGFLIAYLWSKRRGHAEGRSSTG